MFDPAQYGDLVREILWSRRDDISFPQNTGFIISPEQGPWETILWRADLLFDATGHILEVLETYGLDGEGKPLRQRRYRLVCSEGKEIFRLDTHGRECPFSEPCHVHTAHGEILENGDGKLSGYDLADIDFPKAFSLSYGYIFKYKKLPWE